MSEPLLAGWSDGTPIAQWAGGTGLFAHPSAALLIVLDLYMPIVDGWPFHRAQLRPPARAGIAVIVMPAVAAALEPFA